MRSIRSAMWIVVLNAAIDQQPVFADGFESGDTTAWSTVSP